MPGPDLTLWAVHISDGVLTEAWWVGGFVAAGVLALVGAWRIQEEQIAQTALLTAAFFVASLVHVRVGPTSVHLLLNGLVGVVLGRRAALAIPVGLAMQAALLGHGGFSTVGVNSCVMVLPALLAWWLFAGLHRLPWLRRPWFRAALVAVSTLAWTLSLVYSIALLVTNGLSRQELDTSWANRLTFHPATLALAGLLAGLAAWLERRLENAPEFPLGLLVGEVTVLATLALNCLVLLWGSEEKEAWRPLALLVFVAHLPIAAVEGIVLGFTVGFVARVKPQLLGWKAPPLDLPPDALAPAPLARPSANGHIQPAERPSPVTEEPPCSADPLP
ncbi:MAG TPA: CbiM family transporter [Gemmataceae bacterium]|nr:CbiM family transporter [Gemmataceae bacterium]